MENVDITLFRTRLRKRLKEKKMTYKRLTEETGINENTIDKWLNGVNEPLPSLNKIYKVAQALDVSIDYFVNPDMTCRTFSNQKISEQTGLSDEAIEGLKLIRKDDIESDDLNKMAQMIKKTDSDFHIMLRRRMTIVNFLLSHYDILEEYIDAFVKYATPNDFTVPVIRTNDGKWTPFNEDISCVALASSIDNLDDNMILDIVNDYRAMAKNLLDMAQNRLVHEYAMTDPDYVKKCLNGLKEAYKKRTNKTKKGTV